MFGTDGRHHFRIFVGWLICIKNRQRKVDSVQSLGEPPYLIYNSKKLSLWEKIKRFILRVPEHEGVKVSEKLDRERLEEIFYKPNLPFTEEIKNWWREKIENRGKSLETGDIGKEDIIVWTTCGGVLGLILGATIGGLGRIIVGSLFGLYIGRVVGKKVVSVEYKKEKED